MTSVLLNDATTAIKDQSHFKGMEIIPITKIKVERIVSMADFKSKNIDFRSLRPAIMINQSLLVENKRKC
jgi:hypothetical protein